MYVIIVMAISIYKGTYLYIATCDRIVFQMLATESTTKMGMTHCPHA
jgi:hypothetical protein